MRTAVIIFYWLCAIFLIILSLHAEYTGEDKSGNQHHTHTR